MKRYLNIFLHPLVLLAFWVAYLLSFFLSVVRYFYIRNPLAYFPIVGRVANLLWHLSPILLVVFMLDLVFYIWNYAQNMKDSKRKSLFYVIGVSSIFTFILANCLLGLELFKYGNYLYSAYGITKPSVYLLSYASLVIIILFCGFLFYDKKLFLVIQKKFSFVAHVSLLRFLFYNRKPFLPNRRRFRFPAPTSFLRSLLYNKKLLLAVRKRFSFAAIISLGILLWMSIITFTGYGDILFYLRFTYDQEFENYLEIAELKKVVPVKANIILPIESMTWTAIGNPPITRYFLYPRILISSLYITGQSVAESIGEAYFIILIKKDTPSWPLIHFQKNEISFTEGVNLSFKSLILIENTNNEVVYKIIF